MFVLGSRDVEINDEGSGLLLSPDTKIANKSIDLGSDMSTSLWRMESSATFGVIFKNYRRALVIALTFAAFY